jgi:hypothetical protein
MTIAAGDERQLLGDVRFWPIDDVLEGQLWIGSSSGYDSHPEGVAKTATVVKIETGLAQPCDIVLLPARPCLML